MPGQGDAGTAPIGVGGDLGDAPDTASTTFPSLAQNDGPFHDAPEVVFLGHGVDRELNSAQINLDAFDDGIVATSPLSVQITLPSGTTSPPYIPGGAPFGVDPNPKLYLNVLADLDGSLGWDATNEWVGVDIPVPLTAGSVTSTVTVTGFDLGALRDGVWVRISLTDERLQDTLGAKSTSTFWDGSWTGGFSLGETEDYLTPVTPPAPVQSMIYGDLRFQSVVQPSQIQATGARVIAQSLSSSASSTALVSKDGSFFFGDLPPGAYSFTASAAGFIDYALTSVIVSSTGTGIYLAPLPAIDDPPGTDFTPLILAGLVNSDSVVNIQDISAVANSFGQLVSDRTDSFGRTIDINADGIVSILDLSAVASNFGTASPLPWPE